MSKKKGRKKGPLVRPAPHASDLVVQARVDEFIGRILDGAQFWGLKEFVRAQERVEGSNWFVGPQFTPMHDSTIWDYKARACAAIRAARERDRDKAIDDGLMKRLHWVGKAIEAGDIPTALKCQSDHDKLAGYYPAAPLPAGLAGTPLLVTLEEATARVRTLHAGVDDVSGVPDPAASGEAGAGGPAPVR